VTDISSDHSLDEIMEFYGRQLETETETEAKASEAVAREDSEGVVSALGDARVVPHLEVAKSELAIWRRARLRAARGIQTPLGSTKDPQSRDEERAMKTMRKEIAAYKNTVEERLHALGGKVKPWQMDEGVSDDPAGAVIENVLRYHQHCKSLGIHKAFERADVLRQKPTPREKLQLNQYIETLEVDQRAPE